MLAGLIVASFSAVGCSSSLLAPSGGSPAEVDALKGQIVELRKKAIVGEVEVARLEREVAHLKAELARVRVPTPPPVAETDLSGSPDAPSADFDPVGLGQPEIEESDLEPPVVEAPAVEAEPAAAPEPQPSPANPRTRPTTTLASADDGAQRLYDEGYTLFHRQKYSESEDRFQRYVDSFPETDLADNALFWIGESRYARGDFSGALDAFSKTVERFPQGNKVADALFKAGRCLESLGEVDQARSTYEEIASRYAGSAASAQARDRLDALR